MKNQYQFIAVEGVIGAGKTSLAKILAERHQARLVLEEFEENPFLPKFYKERERYAFQTQLAFLASRFRQQEVLKNHDLFHELVISDYLFDKDRIFARLNLSGEEMALYDSIYSIMNSIAARADLVVYIQSSVDRLMKNIRDRGRPYEKEITRDYIEELNNAYNHFFHHYAHSPLLIVNASEVDFVHDKNHLKYIEDQIFYEPMRSSKTHITPR